MKNKRFFFEREEDIKMQNFFVGKKREISNSIPQLGKLQTFYKDQIVNPNLTIFTEGDKKYIYTKEDISEKISAICKQVYVKFGK